MSFLKELTDKGATIAWSTVAAHPSLIALGTKDSGGGSGFEDHGGELELHKLDFSQETDTAAGGSGGGGAGAGTLLGKVKTTARFATLAWSEMATKQAEYPYGLIAGGMGDGTVNVWDPAKLVASHPQPQVASVARHSGPVTGLNFNPHKSSSHLLASGGADSEVFIMALDRPDAPTVFVPGPKPNTSRHTAEVTKVAWNSQVSHIMATAAQNGSCIVWDLKQKKPWCELRDPNRAPITDVAWNPDQGQHLVTASGDDNNPVLKLWDLRSSTTLPLATLSGHSEGVLSVAWCPYDASLLMSCAKDNRTLLWDLFSLKPVYELPPGAGAELPQENAQMFGGYGKTAQRRYQVSWSPHIPAVVSTCSFDRKVQLFSMNGASTSSGRAPKWHRRPAGASFAFGGRLVSFSAAGGDAAAGNAAVGQQGAGGGGGGSGTVKISSVKEDAAFVAASRRFEEAMASQGFRGFCQEKEASAATAHERRVWQFMQVIFEKNARNQLLAHLGFDGETVARQAAEFVAAASKGRQDNGGSSLVPPPPRGDSPNAGGGSILDDESEGAGGDGIPAESELAEAMAGVDLDETKFSKPGGSGGLFSGAPPGAVGGGAGGGGVSNGQPLSKEAEAVIKRSLLVGNFEAAVQCCMSTGNMADAMLLASCGGADLWAKTQAQYFARESQQRPFLKVVNAIIKSELGVLVEASDLGQWQETLAILSTYAKQEEFPTLCEALASRLEAEAGDRKSANLCYMCAVKVPKTVEMWAEELKSANAAINGGTDTKALQDFVEKVSVFTQEPNDPPGEEVSAIFAEYAGILASEGETETAFKYIKGQGQNGAVLQDRLYHSAPHAAGTPAPPFPFERARVGVSPQSVVGGGSGAGVGGGGGANGATAGGGGAGSARARSDPRASTAAGGGGDALPPGWTQMMDPSRNIPYYCNTATGETQWERPAPPPVAAATRAVPSPHAPRMPQATSSPYNRGNPAAAGAAGAGATASFPPSPVKPGYAGPISALTAGGATFGRPQQHHQPHQQQQQQHQQQHQQHQQHQRQYSNPMASGGVAAPYAGPGGATMMNAGPGGGGGGGAYPPAAAGGPAGGMSAASSSSPYQQGGFVGGGAPGGAGGYPGGAGFPGDGGGSNRMRPGGGAGVGPGGAPGGAVHSAMGGMREGSGAGGMMPSSPSPPGAPPAAAAPTSTASAASSVAAAAPAPPPPSDAESQAVVSALNGMLGALSEAPLSPPEKKMLGDVTKAVGILFGKMGRGQVEQETLAKVGQLVESLQARDIKTAGAVQQGLANSAWASHKDWLKGLKYLTTLVSRRLV